MRERFLLLVGFSPKVFVRVERGRESLGINLKQRKPQKLPLREVETLPLICKPTSQLCFKANAEDWRERWGSKNMQAVKATGSKIEITLAKALFARGHRYRKNDRTVFGKPDLTFKRHKLAVFVDSEFWHPNNWNTNEVKGFFTFEFPVGDLS